ncbi:hypothetical protein JYK14_24515 [Siccirubricoccus sp. KC 17139]|uniref:Uncharacterized protein n=1 Tax=Siccirubricoccus soli TaxID=2899147 RepID=A0ABT1DBM6_9PROT|nr:hypothetical protein [Siccirubricoccus soli]MCO6419299.1 hypothetical protein [Siccirubricoccus soli]MCP2685434.1 hypothetical protein [Siccirubricoccus soli]
MRVARTNLNQGAGFGKAEPASGLLQVLYALASGDQSGTSLDDWRQGAKAHQILRDWASHQSDRNEAAVRVGW